MKEQEVHRSGPFKQDNKRHKLGRHRSNRDVNKCNKVDVKRITKQKDLLRRHERRNQMKQIRDNKREQTVNAKRMLGKDCVPPIIVAVVGLSRDDYHNHVKQFVNVMRNCDQTSIIDEKYRQIHINFVKLKTKFEFVLIDSNDLYSALDSVKIADILLVLHTFTSVNTPLLDAIYSHCLPTTVHAICGLNELGIKKRNELRKTIQKFIENKFGDEKLRSVDTESEALQLMHYMSNCRRKQISFRSHRSQVLAENLDFECTGNIGSEITGTLRVSGFVRNRALDANSLVHIPGFGDYQMSLIEASDATETSDPIEGNISRIIQRADPSLQQTLETENIIDPMDGEQTWPTAEELEEALNERKVSKKLVPKGTSEYQAVWIVDNEDDESDNESGDESSDEDLEVSRNNIDSKMETHCDSDSDNENENDLMEDKEECDVLSISESTNEANYDQKMDLNEENEMLNKFKDERRDQMFPDEIDTPLDKAAKTRFARYRGLKSFRTSTWDAKEILPKDYARIFQFENFCRTKRKVFNQEVIGAHLGWFVTIHVINVPQSVYQSFNENKKPLILYGLLPHEQKMSVMNLVIKRHPSFSEPIKSKERLVFHVGCRRFAASPIFSAHTNGDKHKMERFLRSDAPVVASLYAPITFPPTSVLVYKEYVDGSQHLVANGSLLDCNPDRTVIKRIVLSGHPFKINRNHAVVRYMFFNRDDILWFKPIELRTKYGRKGHIKEALGTHGHMKCVFDKQLKSQDTVLMNLYKRVYPKWTYDPIVTYANNVMLTE